MAKTLIPQKMVLGIDAEGMTSAVLVYQVNDNGVTGKAKTISVKDGIVVEQAEAVINAAISTAENSEGI